MATNGTPPESVSLLKMKNSKVNLQAEGLAAIQGWPAQHEPLSLVAICGAARQGKSMLLNSLLRTPDSFTVSDSPSPCTEGVDVSRSVVTLNEFNRSCGQFDVQQIAFADVEGQGACSAQHDLLQVVPIMLLSNVLIFNWLGLPNVATILDSLALLCEAAAQVMDAGSINSAAGNLVVVLRDCVADERECYELIFTHEDPASARDSGKAAEIIGRNGKRDKICELWANVRVVCLPHYQSPAFAPGLDRLREKLSPMLRSPRQFGGAVITPTIVAHLLPDLVTAVNAGIPSIAPQGFVHACQTRRIANATSAALRTFANKERELTAKCEQVTGKTLPQAAIAAFITHTKALCMAAYDDSLYRTGCPVTMVAAGRESLSMTVATRLENVKSRHTELRHELNVQLRRVLDESLGRCATAIAAIDTNNCTDQNAVTSQYSTTVCKFYNEYTPKIDRIVSADLRDSGDLPAVVHGERTYGKSSVLVNGLDAKRAALRERDEHRATTARQAIALLLLAVGFKGRELWPNFFGADDLAEESKV